MDVTSRQLIDAQFDRAVEIVQGLPKTGPIQTGYEEKLNMYRCAHHSFAPNCDVERGSVACISKVIMERTSSLFAVLISSRDLSDHYSHCRQCSRTPSQRLGYARKGEMVRTDASAFQTHNHMLTPGPLLVRDAWAKHKDLDPYEAKWLYVDALLKVRLCSCE